MSMSFFYIVNPNFVFPYSVSNKRILLNEKVAEGHDSD